MRKFFEDKNVSLCNTALIVCSPWYCYTSWAFNRNMEYTETALQSCDQSTTKPKIITYYNQILQYPFFNQIRSWFYVLHMHFDSVVTSFVVQMCSFTHHCLNQIILHMLWLLRWPLYSLYNNWNYKLQWLLGYILQMQKKKKYQQLTF